jgi:hypothetical protein
MKGLHRAPEPDRRKDKRLVYSEGTVSGPAAPQARAGRTGEAISLVSLQDQHADLDPRQGHPMGRR